MSTLTIDIIHECLDCDGDTQDEIEHAHQSVVPDKKVVQLVEMLHLDASTARDLLMHFPDLDPNDRLDCEGLVVGFIDHYDCHVRSAEHWKQQDEERLITKLRRKIGLKRA